MTARVVIIGRESARRSALGLAFMELGAEKVNYVEAPLDAVSLLSAEGMTVMIVLPGARQLALQRLMLEHRQQGSQARMYALVSGAPDESPPPGIIPLEDSVDAKATAERLWRELQLVVPRFEKRDVVSYFWAWRVWQAWDRKREQLVLLAQPEEGGRDEERDASWLEEARKAQALQHRNLPPLLEVGEVDDQIFQIWEYQPGMRIKDRLYPRFRKGTPPLSVESCVWVATEVAAALAEVHRAGLCHYLIDPFSVWVMPDGGVQLRYLGFGREASESRFWIRNCRTGAVDTHEDRAPEELHRTHPWRDARTDVYRLGLLLVEMLWRYRPLYKGHDPLAERKAILEETPTPPLAKRPEVPEALVALMLRMLEKDPDRRPANGAEVLAALEPFRACGAPDRAPEDLVAWVQEFLRSGGEDSGG